MTDLSTTYLGLELRSPLVASSSPLTGDLTSLQALDAAGVGAVVLPSLFEEQIEHDSLAVHDMLETGAGAFPEAPDGFFAELEDDNTGPSRYLRHLEAARSKLEVPVIASLNGASPGGWVSYARMLEDAGASAIELNLYRIAADTGQTGQDVEAEELEVVRATVVSVGVPIAVKVGPFYSSFAHFASQVLEAGARGLVLFNRFYQPDIDLDSLTVEPRLVLSTSDELRLPLRWTGMLHGRVHGSLAVTTGIHTGEDAMKALLAGADAVMLASALLRHGPDHVRTVIQEMQAWMGERGYASVRQLQGSVSQQAIRDPSAFERANYVRTLVSYANSPGSR